MSFPGAHNFTIDRSTFYDVRGGLHQSTTAPGERGISDLFKASCPDAFHDSQARYPPPQCLPGTRADLLKEVFTWIQVMIPDEKILWISGPAGAGKTAIAQTVADACAKSSILAASFFFFHGASGRNTSDGLILSIVYQLVITMPDKRVQIGQIVEEDPSILYKPLEIQIEKLILPLFAPPSSGETHADTAPSHSQIPSVIIIDGLDECRGDNSQRDVVQHIGQLVCDDNIPLRFVIVSRPEPQIEESFGHLAGTFRSISLGTPHHISQVNDDIRAYLRHGFNQIYQKRELITEQFWPTEDIISTLVNKAGGAFIYASTVLKYVDDDDFHPKERLEEILDTPRGLMPFAELDHLYCRILGAYPDTKRLLQVLTISCICTNNISNRAPKDASCSLCARDIEFLLQLPPGVVVMTLRRMRSILRISEQTHISFYHKSFVDFLHNRERAGRFFIDIEGGNAFVTLKLLVFLRSPAGAHRPDFALRAPRVKFRLPGSKTVLMQDLSLADYAEQNWYKHMIASGGCDTHPYRLDLLEEVSKMLDFNPLFTPIELPCTYELLLFLQWFEVREPLPIRRNYNPWEMQYQLFKNLWSQVLKRPAWKSFHIYVLYEDVDIYALMDHIFKPNEGQILPTLVFARDTAYGAIRLGTPQFWVFVENQSPRSNEDSDEWRLLNNFDAVWKRFLQEPGMLEEHLWGIAKGHASVVCQCLNIITRWYFFSDQAEHIYARKYWIHHLLNVPHGDKNVLDALENFQCEKAASKLTTDEINSVRTWLEASGVTPYGAWCGDGRRETV